METRTIAQRLALAEARVQQGDGMVRRQRTRVRHLERHSLGTFHASRLLKQLEDTQAGFIAERDQLEIEMALSSARPAGPAISGPPHPVAGAADFRGLVSESRAAGCAA